MVLSRLEARRFRNLQDLDIPLSPRVSAITGRNAAGKTSVLEAIFCLTQARSFRSSNLDMLAQGTHKSFLVRGELEGTETMRRLVFHHRPGRSRIRLDGKDVHTLSLITGLLPTQLINTESQRLLTDSPEVRRATMNWGVFHVEHRFATVWRSYRRALRQRNVALREGSSRLAGVWERDLTAHGYEIHSMREKYLEMLLPRWKIRAAAWLDITNLHWRYTPGWDQKQSLHDAFAERRTQELALGYTLSGPHRADLRLRTDSADAHHVLSRGQQKLAVIAFRLAQVDTQAACSKRVPIALVDDLAAELDPPCLEDVCTALHETGAQVVMTALDDNRLPALPFGSRLFHVEQGRCQEVVQ